MDCADHEFGAHRTLKKQCLVKGVELVTTFKDVWDVYCHFLQPIHARRCVTIYHLFRCINWSWKCAYLHHFHTSFMQHMCKSMQTNITMCNHYACESITYLNERKQMTLRRKGKKKKKQSSSLLILAQINNCHDVCCLQQKQTFAQQQLAIWMQ